MDAVDRWEPPCCTGGNGVVVRKQTALARPPAAQLKRKRTRSTTWMLLVPTLYLGLFFVAPILQMLGYSFYKYDPLRIMVPEFTLENYAALFLDAHLQTLIGRTIWLSLLATVVCIILAFPVATRLVLARGTEKTILTLIVLSPIMISPIVLAHPWLVILAPNSGLLTKLVEFIGLKAPTLMYTQTGVLIGLTYGGVVFMIMSLHAAMENIQPSLQQAASVLGATPWQTFRKVTLPLALPGLVSGSLMVFSVSTSSFMMPYLIGGRQVQVLATYAYDMASVLMNWPSASAVAGVLVVIAGMAVLVFNAWATRLERRLGHVD